MKCEKCGLDAKISNSFTKVTGDNSPDEQTKVFAILVFECRNPNCDNFNKQIGQVEHQTFPEVN